MAPPSGQRRHLTHLSTVYSTSTTTGSLPKPGRCWVYWMSGVSCLPLHGFPPRSQYWAPQPFLSTCGPSYIIASVTPERRTGIDRSLSLVHAVYGRAVRCWTHRLPNLLMSRLFAPRDYIALSRPTSRIFGRRQYSSTSTCNSVPSFHSPTCPRTRANTWNDCRKGSKCCCSRTVFLPISYPQMPLAALAGRVRSLCVVDLVKLAAAAMAGGLYRGERRDRPAELYLIVGAAIIFRISTSSPHFSGFVRK